jgi:peroxiredoxin Q/BCP
MQWLHLELESTFLLSTFIMPLPQTGQKFPDFSSPVAWPDGEQSTLSLAAFRGAPLVIFFYPKDATSGCTIEVCGFRDEYSGFQELGVQVLGVSRDKVSAHARFIQNQALPYPLLADPEQKLIRACDLLVNKTMYGKPVTKVLRTTFALDESGVVLKVWESVTPLGHAREVLSFLQERV